MSELIHKKVSAFVFAKSNFFVFIFLLFLVGFLTTAKVDSACCIGGGCGCDPCGAGTCDSGQSCSCGGTGCSICRDRPRPTSRPNPTSAPQPTREPTARPEPTDPPPGCNESCGGGCPWCGCDKCSGDCDYSCDDDDEDPTDTPDQPTSTPTPIPVTCTVQGYKILDPSGAGIITEIANQSIRNSAGASLTTTNPYFITVPQGNTTLKVDVPAGYSIFGTVCTNRVDCHTANDASRFNTNETTVNCPAAGGYIDLWWHYVKRLNCPPASSIFSQCNFVESTGTMYGTFNWGYATNAGKYILRVDQMENRGFAGYWPSWYGAGDARMSGVLDLPSQSGGMATQTTVQIVITPGAKYRWAVEPGWLNEVDNFGYASFAADDWTCIGPDTQCPYPPPQVNIQVKNQGGSAVKVPYLGFTYECHFPLCFSGISNVVGGLSGFLASGLAGFKGGGGITLYDNQVILGITPAPAGGATYFKTSSCTTCSDYEENSITSQKRIWQSYWWPTMPLYGTRDLTFIVATHTPTPTTIPQLKVTGVIQQQTGSVKRNVSTSFHLPFVDKISLNNNTRWTLLGTACATGYDPATMYGAEQQRLAYGASYTFPVFAPGKGYCIPQVITATGFKLPVEATVITIGMPTAFYELLTYGVNVTTTNPTVLNIPIKYKGESWIRLKDASFSRPVTTALANNMPYIVDKFDATDDLDRGMISENVVGSGGFVPSNIDLDPLGISSTNNWKLPAGYTFNESVFSSRIVDYVTQVLRTQGVTDVTIGAGSPDKVLAAGFNKAPHNKSVGTITTDSGLPAVLIVIDGTSLGNITITKDTGVSPLLIIANKISIGKDVTALNAILVAKDKIDLNGGTATDKPLKIKGNVVTGGGMINLRSRSDKDHARPSMFIQFDYEMYQKLVDIIGVVGSGG